MHGKSQIHENSLLTVIVHTDYRYVLLLHIVIMLSVEEDKSDEI